MDGWLEQAMESNHYICTFVCINVCFIEIGGILDETEAASMYQPEEVETVKKNTQKNITQKQTPHKHAVLHLP